MRAIEIARTL